MTSVTIESTSLDDQWRRRRLGPDLWQRTEVLLDERDSLLGEVDELRGELQRLQAAERAVQADKLQAMQDRARHAGSTKSSRKHAAIDTAIDDHRLQLPLHLWKSRRSRAEWLKRVMGEGAPHWRTIDTYLNTLRI